MELALPDRSGGVAFLQHRRQVLSTLLELTIVSPSLRFATDRNGWSIGYLEYTNKLLAINVLYLVNDFRDSWIGMELAIPRLARVREVKKEVTSRTTGGPHPATPEP